MIRAVGLGLIVFGAILLAHDLTRPSTDESARLRARYVAIQEHVIAGRFLEAALAERDFFRDLSVYGGADDEELVRNAGAKTDAQVEADFAARQKILSEVSVRERVHEAQRQGALTVLQQLPDDWLERSRWMRPLILALFVLGAALFAVSMRPTPDG